ncbi:MAG TPA: hypothetical protein PLQ76_08800, partial [bacterium]|nr:hypothetical protein [bacterium]
MNRRAATFIFIALAVFLARPVKAADSIAVSDFFREGTSARSLGMGGAFAGLADDVGTIYWNPAGLMSIKGAAFSTTRSSIGGDLDLNTQSMSFALPVVGHGVAGFSLVYTSLGDMILTGLDSHSRLIPIGTIGEDDTGFSMSYAWPWRENTDVGITFKGAKQKLGGNSVNGWG